MPLNPPQPPAFKPTFFHVPPGPVAGGTWKFKAMGYGAAGGMEPGHGPLTDQHNMQFDAPGAAEVSARLLGVLGSTL